MNDNINNPAEMTEAQAVTLEELEGIDMAAFAETEEPVSDRVW